MSEAVDPGIEVSQSSASPQPQPPNELGQGFAEDTIAGNLPSDNGQVAASEDSEETSPEAPAAETAAEETQPDPNSAESPEAGMRRDDYQRKTAELAEQRRAFEAERANWYKERQQDLQTPSTPQQTQPDTAPVFTADVADQIIAEAGLTPEEGAGIRAIQRLNSTTLNAQTQIIDGLRKELEDIKGQIRETGEVTTQLTEKQNQELRREMERQVNEAKQLFGEEAVTSNADALLALTQTVNRKTGNLFTVAEAAGILTGKTPEEARQAREQNQGARRQARRAASVPGANTTAPGTNGRSYLSEQEAIAQINDTM